MRLDFSSSKGRGLLQIHLAVALFGMASLFGKWVALPATLIVLGRVFFAGISLALVLLWSGRGFGLNRRRDYASLGLLGVVLAFHWVTFFHSVQVSTVAIAVITFSTFPVFTVLLEPLFFREHLSRAELTMAMITFGGVILVVPEYNWSDAAARGAFWGVMSGLSFAVLALLNRLYVRSYSSMHIAFYQDGFAALVLMPFLFVGNPDPSPADWWLLLLLGVVFTALSHTLFIEGLKYVRASRASIIATLEPVYGILAAAVLLGEIPSPRTIAGGLVILSVAVYLTRRSRQ